MISIDDMVGNRCISGILGRLLGGDKGPEASERVSVVAGLECDRLHTLATNMIALLPCSKASRSSRELGEVKKANGDMMSEALVIFPVALFARFNPEVCTASCFIHLTLVQMIAG